MLIDYLAVGLVCADYWLIKNMFIDNKKMGYDNYPFWIKLVSYLADIFTWPISIAIDLFRITT